MSGDTGRPAGESAPGEARDGTTLVLGDISHDEACRRLATEGTERAYRVRATTDAPSGACCADVDELYETSVYDALALSEAGIAVSDTVANLDDDRLTAGRLVVCVDGLPQPADESGRQQLLQFLHAVTHRVATADGHCHAHLGVDADDALAAVVAPLFETVVDAGD